MQAMTEQAKIVQEVDSYGWRCEGLKVNGEKCRARKQGKWYCYDSDGKVNYRKYYKDGKKDRDDGPAMTAYDPQGRVRFDTWFKDGREHRDDGPAVIHYYENGMPKYKGWYRNGERFREGGLAVRVWFHEDGSVGNYEMN